jgi:hypothetical protein
MGANLISSAGAGSLAQQLGRHVCPHRLDCFLCTLFPAQIRSAPCEPGCSQALGALHACTASNQLCGILTSSGMVWLQCSTCCAWACCLGVVRVTRTNLSMHVQVSSLPCCLDQTHIPTACMWVLVYHIPAQHPSHKTLTYSTKACASLCACRHVVQQCPSLVLQRHPLSGLRLEKLWQLGNQHGRTSSASRQSVWSSSDAMHLLP